MKICSICGKAIENEEAAVLTISAYGNPRFVCDDCGAKIDTVMESQNVEEIEPAINFLGEKLKEMKDGNSIAEVCNILEIAGERFKKIKEGTYDFDTDNKIKEIKERDSLDEIPEDLQEAEEDRALDEKEAEQQKKFDNAMNWISLAAISVTLIILIISFFS